MDYLYCLTRCLTVITTLTSQNILDLITSPLWFYNDCTFKIKYCSHHGCCLKWRQCTALIRVQQFRAVSVSQKAPVKELSIENRSESDNRIFWYFATSQLNHIKRNSCIIYPMKSGIFSREYTTDWSKGLSAVLNQHDLSNTITFIYWGYLYHQSFSRLNWFFSSRSSTLGKPTHKGIWKETILNIYKMI